MGSARLQNMFTWIDAQVQRKWGRGVYDTAVPHTHSHFFFLSPSLPFRVIMASRNDVRGLRGSSVLINVPSLRIITSRLFKRCMRMTTVFSDCDKDWWQRLRYVRL